MLLNGLAKLPFSFKMTTEFISNKKKRLFTEIKSLKSWKRDLNDFK